MQKYLTIRNPYVATLATLLIATAVWGISKAALSIALDYSVASSLQRIHSTRYLENLNLTLDSVDDGYVQQKEYVSKTIQTKHGFNALGVKIEEETPSGTRIDIFVRAGTGNTWTDWIEIERDDDGFFSEREAVFSKLIPLSSHKEFQYRVALASETSSNAPVLRSLEVICINSSGYLRNVYSTINLGFLKRAFAADSILQVITRRAWGADERIRLWDDTRPEPQLAKIEQEEIDQFIHENPVVRRVKSDDSDRRLTWPQEYTATVDKIVIHHTASQAPQTYADSVSYLRAVYYYHSVTRGWGDIGYNYIIDPFGNVYEGRAGGDFVVGAHAGLANRGTVGIALMGDFNRENVSPAQLRSLIQLVTALSKKYGINPEGSTIFRGQLMPNVVGHRDVGVTSCPGEDLYGLLPSILTDAAHGSEITVQAIIEKPDFVKESERAEPKPVRSTDKQPEVLTEEVTAVSSSQEHTAVSSYGNPLSAGAVSGETGEIVLRFDNRGDIVWNKRTYLASTFRYPGVSVGNDDIVFMEEEFVQPGETATFKIPVTAHSDSNRRYQLVFDIHINGFMLDESAQYRMDLDVTASDISDDDHEKLSTAGNTQTNSFAATSQTIPAAVSYNVNEIRVKIDFTSQTVVVTGNGEYSVYADGVMLGTVSDGSHSRVTREKDTTSVVVAGTTYTTDSPVRFVGSPDTVLTVVNFDRPLLWDPTANDNQFRGTLEVYTNENELSVINELSIREYLYGVGEVSENGTHSEKKKVMAVAARTYALYYMTQAQKFPGEPYMLDDLARNSQKYLGYGFEKRSPQWVSAVDATEGEVVTYKGTLVKTPYFSQSDGRTRSAEEVWGWTETPYLQSVPDPLCANKELLGHGVGLSGCGSEMAAREGHSYKDILKYYYRGIEVQKLY